MTCQCGHDIERHYSIVKLGSGQEPASRCIECDCRSLREAPEQADIFGTEAS